MAVSDWYKRRLLIDQKTTGHNSQPSNATVLKARQELSPLENSVADCVFTQSAKIEIWTLRKSRTQLRPKAFHLVGSSDIFDFGSQVEVSLSKAQSEYQRSRVQLFGTSFGNVSWCERRGCDVGSVEAPKEFRCLRDSGPSVGRRGAKMDVTVLLFRLYEGVGAALATRPQKCKIEKYRCRKWEAQKPKTPGFLVSNS